MLSLVVSLQQTNFFSDGLCAQIAILGLQNSPLTCQTSKVQLRSTISSMLWGGFKAPKSAQQNEVTQILVCGNMRCQRLIGHHSLT